MKHGMAEARWWGKGLVRFPCCMEGQGLRDGARKFLKPNAPEVPSQLANNLGKVRGCAWLPASRRAGPSASCVVSLTTLCTRAAEPMVFPLFDLPPEAVELVLGAVKGLEDKRALRLVCKRSRAELDSRVTAVKIGFLQPVGKQQLAALVRAPWQLQRVDLSGGELDRAFLAAARWTVLQVLNLDHNNLEFAGASSVAAAPLPVLRELHLSHNNVGNAGAAALAAAHWPALHVLRLGYNSLGYAGAAALVAARWPAIQCMSLYGNGISSESRAALKARCPSIHF